MRLPMIGIAELGTVLERRRLQSGFSLLDAVHAECVSLWVAVSWSMTWAMGLDAGLAGVAAVVAVMAAGNVFGLRTVVVVGADVVAVVVVVVVAAALGVRGHVSQ